MAAPKTSPTTFNNTSPPWSLALLDANFSAFDAAISKANNYGNYLVDTGAVNAYVVTFPATMTVTLSVGLPIQFVTTNANSGASTINVNGLGAVAITKNGSTALDSGDIPANTIIAIQYDGTQFQIVGPKYSVMTATVGGLVPTPPNNTTTFLRGDGTFASVGGTTLPAPVDTSTGQTQYTVNSGLTGVKRIDFAYGGISTNGTATVLIRIGPAAGLVSTGYVGAVFDATTSTAVTDGFDIDNMAGATVIRHGRGSLQLIDAATNKWSWSSQVLNSAANQAPRFAAGTITLAGPLTQFQLYFGGTDTGDAGYLGYQIFS